MDINDQNIPWYLDSKYERYWQVYSSCMFQAHIDALSRSREESILTAATLYSTLKGPLPPSSPPKSIIVKKSKKCRNRRNRRKRSKTYKRMKSKDDMFILTDDDTLQVSQVEGMHIQDDSEEEEEELDLAYLEFMEQNLKHRLKYSQVKASNVKFYEESENSGHIFNIQEHPDDIRNKEMKLQYGSSAAQIHAKETAMQLSFDRISTLHQPSLWPNIPLKLNY